MTLTRLGAVLAVVFWLAAGLAVPGLAAAQDQ